MRQSSERVVGMEPCACVPLCAVRFVWVMASLMTLTICGGCAKHDSQRRASEPAIAAWATGVAREKLTNASCITCHPKAGITWGRSDHAAANRPVDMRLDAVAFAGQTASSFASDYRFSRDADGDLTIRESSRDGDAIEFHPAMVIARDPLWQYVVELQPGRFQCTEVAWDPRAEAWFAVNGREERNPGEWGHWTGRGMNWNSMCARCHMTAYAKNYDSATDAYHSRWSEQGVGCVQCHNTMPGHESGGAAMDGVDNFARDPYRMMDTCASCHSRAEALTAAFVPGERFDDHFRLQLPVEPALYYPDGQIRDEVFVYGSFRHSKMFAAGVTCMDCHEPHSGALTLPEENNQLCLQCHGVPGRLNAPTIDPTAHSHHAADSAGNRCVECHMARTTYMQRDPRGDHGFIIPDPVLTRELGVPNACGRCHESQTLQWNVEHFEAWYGESTSDPRRRVRACAVHAAYEGNVHAVPTLLDLLGTEKVSAWKASLLTLASRLAPGTDDVVGAARKLKDDVDPLVRAAAVAALASAPGSVAELKTALDDPMRLVRLEAAWARSAELPVDSPVGRELASWLRDDLDQPAGRYRMAQDAFNRGQTAKAIEFLDTAEQWDPLSAVIPESKGYMLDSLGRSREAALAFERASERASGDAQAAFRSALSWAGAGDLERAETMLGVALRRDPGMARAWYNLGLVEAKTDRRERAIVSLREAERLEPREPDFPYALATVYAQLGRLEDARAAAKRSLEADSTYTPAISLLRQIGPPPSR